MTERAPLPRRAFLQLAAGVAIGAAALAACEATRPPAPPPRSPRPTTPGNAPTASPPATQTPSSSTPGPPGTPSPSVAAENRRSGSPGWDVGIGRPSSVEGFAIPASVEPGERIALHVSSPVAYDVDWYRLGWYGGAGARRVHRDAAVPASPDRALRVDASTGLVEAAWPEGPSTVVTDAWPSGIYVAVLRPRDGTAPSGVPFVVRAPLRSMAPAVFLSAQATWQAYNAWGGRSLYSYNSRGAATPTGTAASAVVGLDRPFDMDGGLGHLRKWEAQFVRWMERTGRAVDYAADIDLQARPELLAGRRLAVFAGHPEYWSRPMRGVVEAAVASGMNAAFFTGNEMYWQVRIDPSPLGADRRITCYKSATRDPVALSRPELATCRWREAPVLAPEATFLGVMYGHVVARPADWIVAQAGHWLYDGTGLRDGDALRALVGQEYDAHFPDLAPEGTVVVASSPVRFRGRDPDGAGNVTSPPVHSAAVRDPARGRGGVFAAGTFQWSWALDAYGQHAFNGRRTPLDERVARITANVFDRFSS
jgi:hypothetical protein